MFVGHEALAFALVAGAAAWSGRDRRTALALGGVAALAAVVPDLDLLVGVLSYVRRLGGEAALSMNGFWGVSNVVHRRVTHPLAVVGPAAVGVAAAGVGRRAWTAGDHGRGAAAAVVTGLAVGA